MTQLRSAIGFLIPTLGSRLEGSIDELAAQKISPHVSRRLSIRPVISYELKHRVLDQREARGPEVDLAPVTHTRIWYICVTVG